MPNSPLLLREQRLIFKTDAATIKAITAVYEKLRQHHEKLQEGQQQAMRRC